MGPMGRCVAGDSLMGSVRRMRAHLKLNGGSRPSFRTFLREAGAAKEVDGPSISTTSARVDNRRRAVAGPRWENQLLASPTSFSAVETAYGTRQARSRHGDPRATLGRRIFPVVPRKGVTFSRPETRGAMRKRVRPSRGRRSKEFSFRKSNDGASSLRAYVGACPVRSDTSRVFPGSLSHRLLRRSR